MNMNILDYNTLNRQICKYTSFYVTRCDSEFVVKSVYLNGIFGEIENRNNTLNY